MKMFLVGVRKMDFTGNNGDPVKGTQLHVAFHEEGVSGQAVDKIFVKPEIALPKGIEVGKPFNVNFNRRGKVESIEAIS